MLEDLCHLDVANDRTIKLVLRHFVNGTQELIQFLPASALQI